MISDFGLLDGVLASIVAAIQTYYPQLLVVMTSVLVGLATIRLAAPAIRSILHGNMQGFLPDFAITLLHIGLLLVFMANALEWGQDIIGGFGQITSQVFGVSPDSLTPSGVFNTGLRIVWQLLQAYGHGRWWHPIMNAETDVEVLIVLGCYLAAAVIRLLTLIVAQWTIFTAPIWIGLAGLEQSYDTMVTWIIKLVGIGVYLLLQSFVLAVGTVLAQGWATKLATNQGAITSDIFWMFISICQSVLFAWMVAFIPKALMSLVGHGIGGEFGQEFAGSTPGRIASAHWAAAKAAGRGLKRLEQSSHHKTLYT